MKLKRAEKNHLLQLKLNVAAIANLKKNIVNFMLTLPNWLKCIKYKAYINL